MIEKMKPKVIKNDNKIEASAITGLTFEILGGFWKSWFFKVFVVGKIRRWVAKVSFEEFWGAGRRVGRAVLESWMNSGTGSCTLVPRQARGGGF